MNFTRATRKTPCPICGATKWPCEVTKDGKLALCQNVYSDKRSKDGVTYIHVLEGGIHNNVMNGARPVTPKPPPTSSRVHPDHLHKVYTAMLALLALSDVRRDSLLVRGLPDEEIDARNYKDTPSDEEGSSIAEALSSMELRGVPGFYSDGTRWRMVRCLPGFLIPHRDTQGRIRGLMYRLDIPIEKQKYRWLSSNPDKFGAAGASSGAPLHFARPELIASASEILLTEGALKGDIASYYLNAPFICAGGVTQWGAQFAKHFKARFPHIQRVVIAYDRDWRTNKDVRSALERLMDQLALARLPFVLRTWREDAKGIDDLCLLLSQSRQGRAKAA